MANTTNQSGAIRVCRLLVILGDQLHLESDYLATLDRDQDLVWMCESASESVRTWSSKQRIAFFLAAMRHFRNALVGQGFKVCYRDIGSTGNLTLAQALSADLELLNPDDVTLIHPGEWAIHEQLVEMLESKKLAFKCLPSPGFFCDIEAFKGWASDRRQLRMEHFYRYMRRRFQILMEGDQPVGGRWNFDTSNRKSFGRKGPGMLPGWPVFDQDAITRETIELVKDQFSDHPGSLDEFNWPVDREQAIQALQSFIDERLPVFGPYQDAMWTGEPGLYHSGLSAAINVGLLDPREVVDAAVVAYENGKAPLACVEGFVRQVIGWREFIRGIYWLRMPGLLAQNQLNAAQPIPSFYWTGETDMMCLGQVIRQTLETGYAHHIQRLMVTGLFGLLLGVEPRQMHNWYLSVYADAVEWVELPNTLGMSQFADNGGVASKPYVASGKYINRMSNYCRHCKYDPTVAVGDNACPFTTLYWAFLDNHRDRFGRHPRSALQWRSIERLTAEDRQQIRQKAAKIKVSLSSESGRL